MRDIFAAASSVVFTAINVENDSPPDQSLSDNTFDSSPSTARSRKPNLRLAVRHSNFASPVAHRHTHRIHNYAASCQTVVCPSPAVVQAGTESHNLLQQIPENREIDHLRAGHLRRLLRWSFHIEVRKQAANFCRNKLVRQAALSRVNEIIRTQL